MKQNADSVSFVSGEAQLFDQEGNRKYLNAEERLQFYEEVKRIPERGHRSFCLTLYYTGCRISEALGLRRRSLDHSNKMVIFRTLKQRSKDRYRALPKHVLRDKPFIRDWKKEFDPNKEKVRTWRSNVFFWKDNFSPQIDDPVELRFLE